MKRAFRLAGGRGSARTAARRFAAAAPTYEQAAAVQRAVAARTADLAGDWLPRDVEGWILDVGCGTGLLARMLRQQFPRARILAMDIADGMVREARRRTSDLFGVVADARYPPVRRSCRLIASSSALHWMRPLGRVLRGLAGLTAPGGTVAVGLMLRGTLGELQAARRLVSRSTAPAARLPTRRQVEAAMRAAGLRILHSEAQELQCRYASARAFLRIIHRQGVTGGPFSRGRRLLFRGELQALAEQYDRRYRHTAGGVYATYRILYLVARRPGRRGTRGSRIPPCATAVRA